MGNPAIRLNLKTMVSKEVFIKVRLYNTFIKGTLKSFDQYSNILLENVTEYQQKEDSREFSIVEEHKGPMILRGDSIISLASGMNING